MASTSKAVVEYVKTRPNMRGTSHQGIYSGSTDHIWEGIDQASDADKAFLSDNMDINDVVSSYLYQFGRLPGENKELPVPRNSTDVNKTPDRLMREDTRYPDASNAIFREWLSRHPQDEEYFGY